MPWHHMSAKYPWQNAGAGVFRVVHLLGCRKGDVGHHAVKHSACLWKSEYKME